MFCILVYFALIAVLHTTDILSIRFKRIFAWNVFSLQVCLILSGVLCFSDLVLTYNNNNSNTV